MDWIKFKSGTPPMEIPMDKPWGPEDSIPQMEKEHTSDMKAPSLKIAE